MFSRLNYLFFVCVLLTAPAFLSSCGGGGTKAPAPVSQPEPEEPEPQEPGPERELPVSETDDPNQTGLRVHAETEFTSGNVNVYDTYIGDFSEQGDRVIFTVNMEAASDEVSMGVRYANAGAEAESLTLFVNGLKQEMITFPTTGADVWDTLLVSATLREGINAIAFQVEQENERDVYLGSLFVDGAMSVAAQGKSATYRTFEAESQITNAQVLTASTEFKTFASESSQRQAVQLNNTGDYIEFTAEKSATGLTLRYVIPDSQNGEGLESTLGLYINGERQTIPVTSQYAWVYGAYPYSNNPSDGEAHRFYDESNYRVSIPEGATLRLQKDAEDTAQYYILDLIELESVPDPITKPEGYIDVTDAPYLVDATGVEDATTALMEALADAKEQNVGIYLPAGEFSINTRLSLDNVHVQGAGMWHTTLAGKNGKGGFYGTGSNITITDIKLVSDTKTRKDSEDHAGLEGNFGINSLVQNVWIEHMKVGGWFSEGTNGLYVLNGRVRNTYADGFNFHAGVQNSQISHFNTRNTGDDGFAMWSGKFGSQPNRNNTFSYNTAQLPMLANTYAIYGGDSNRLLNNVAMDTVVSAAGIALSQRFDPYLFSGTTVVHNNSLYRTGGWDYGWNTSFGSVWVFTDGQPIQGAIEISDLTIQDATYDGILVSYNQNVSSLRIANTTIDGSGQHGINVAVTGGELTLDSVTVSNVAGVGLNNHQMSLVEVGNNIGLD